MSKIAENEERGNVHIHVNEERILFKHEIIGAMAAEHVVAGGRVLDVGCGLGQTLEVVQRYQKDLDVCVADAYQVCLDKTSKRIDVDKKYLIHESTFDLSAIPDEEFDLVILSHVLEHLLNPVDAIEQLMRKVKQGGKAIIVVPNPVRPEVMALSALRRHYVNRGHVYAWDRSHWMNFIEKIMGLDVVEFRSDFIRFPMHDLGPMKALSRWMAKVFPHWSNGNIAIVRK